jgi:phenylpropionate dioxygenase-like ring-hydroxylating dioxygenase large terminal subunit
MGWVEALASGALGAGQVSGASLEGHEIVLWRSARGEPCVMEARCPHQWSDLRAEGFVEGEELVCQAHHWRFGLDGRGWKENLSGRRDEKSPIRVFRCREAAGTIDVAIDEGPA